LHRAWRNLSPTIAITGAVTHAGQSSNPVERAVQGCYKLKSEEDQNMDWSNCPLVERDKDIQGGVPVVKGTRIPADTVVTDYELGATPEETHESFPTLPVDTIKKIIAFARTKQLVP
jgi:uncharacterized protein (DUF433 family)